jgi:uncharacterized protein (TIGR03000 family)
MNVRRRLLVLALFALLLSPAWARAQVFFGTSPYAGYGWPRAGYVIPYPSHVFYGTPYAHLHGSPYHFPINYGYWGAATPYAGVGLAYAAASDRWLYDRYDRGRVVERDRDDDWTRYYWDTARARRSLYPAIPYRETPGDASAATIDVNVPDPAARVYFDDTLTSQIGTQRSYVTPPLTPGADYHFDLRAQWRDAGGREQTQTRRVEVRAGQRRSVDFGAGL